MQTTLDTINTSSSSEQILVTETQQDTSISDEYLNYLWEHFSYEGMIAYQIERYIEEEENEKVEQERRVESFLKHEKPQFKPQTYIRVGKHGKHSHN